jgi:hypothetical protein
MRLSDLDISTLDPQFAKRANLGKYIINYFYVTKHRIGSELAKVAKIFPHPFGEKFCSATSPIG